MLNFNDCMKGLCLLALAALLSGCDISLKPGTLYILSQNFPALWKLTTAFAYLAGIIFLFRAVFQLKQYGDMTAMRASGTTIKGPIILFICGAALMFLPTVKSSILVSTFGYGQQLQPLQYSASGVVDPKAVKALLQLMQLMGIISFVRGWIQLSHMANPSGGQHSVGKATTHIIGGILLVNIQGTINTMQTTFGIG
jgi:intracellular multiplication protein IcmC